MTYPLQLLVRQADAVLHADLVTNAALLAENGDALHLDALFDYAGGVAADGNGSTLDTSPGADAAAPTNDGVHHTSIVADLGVFQDDGVLDTGTSTDHNSGANGDVGAKLGGGVDGSSRVDVDRGHDGSGGRGELLRLGLEGLLEVEGVGGHGRASSLDLSPEVLSFVDKEAVAVGQVGEDVLLEAEDFALLAVFVVSGDKGGLEVIGGRVGEEAGTSGAALNGAANGGEDALGGEQVDAAVDEVGDVGLGLLDVVQNTLGVGIGYDAAKVGGSLVRYPSTQNHGLCILFLEQAQHLTQRERAADIGVQHKQALGLALEDRITEVVQSTCGAQRCVLPQVLDADLRELL